MYEGWLLSVQFKWTSILTYRRRRAELLDWLERNTDPVAFADDHEHDRIGVALLSPDLRITVTRAGMVLESGVSGHGIENLETAIQGTFEVMEPQNVLATRYLATGATPLKDADYGDACAAFGRLSGGVCAGDGAFRVQDGSSLVDLASDTMDVQVEWGIVNTDELLRRLTDPHMSRIPARHDDVGQANMVLRALKSRRLPEVAIFNDQHGTWRKGGKVSGVSDVLKLVFEAKQTASTVANDFAENFEDATKGAK